MLSLCIALEIRAKDLDDPNNPNFPNDQINTVPEWRDNVLYVGLYSAIWFEW